MLSVRHLIKEAALLPDVKLYPHQEEAIKNTGPNAIIAHATGAGKTLTGIAKFESMKAEGKANKALVVVPAGLRSNFTNDGIKRFTDSSSNIVGNKAEIGKLTAFNIDPDADYNVISYEMFRSDPERYLKESGADTVITDEVHRTRNDDTATFKSFADNDQFNNSIKNYISLTGSIVNNGPSDIVPLLELASRGNAGLGNKKEFLENYIIRSNAPEYRSVKPERRPVIGFKHRKELIDKIKPYVHFMDHDDVKDIADFPDTEKNVVKVPLTSDQAKAYMQLINNDPKLAEIIKRKRFDTLKNEEAASSYNRLIEARKLMNDPLSVTGQPLNDYTTSPKLDRLMDDMQEHLGETPDGQAIILSHLINGGTEAVEREMKERGIEYGTFTGKGNKGVSEESRQAAIQQYKDGLLKAMIISSAGGEGLSLGNTTWEGVLDPHFNPEKMNQMEARGIRAGGQKHRADKDRLVEVNRYVSTMPKTLGIFNSPYKTPDEIIYEIARNKEEQNKQLHDLLKDVRRVQQGKHLGFRGKVEDMIDRIKNQFSGQSKVAAEEEDEKDNPIKDISTGLFGAGLMRASVDPLTGKKTLYHGTSAEHGKDIDVEGLRADKGGSGGASQAIGHDGFVENSRGKVHLTPRKSLARDFSSYAESAGKETPRVREIVKKHQALADKYNMNIVSQKLDGMPGNIEYKGSDVMSDYMGYNMESSRLSGEYLKAKKSYLKDNRIKPTIKKTVMDYSQFKDLQPDLDMIGGIESSLDEMPAGPRSAVERAIKELAVKTGDNIAPDDLYSNDILRNVKLRMRNIPSEVAKNPKRFGAGVAMAGTGAAMIGKSIMQDQEKEASDKEYLLSSKDHADSPCSGEHSFTYAGGTAKCSKCGWYAQPGGEVTKEGRLSIRGTIEKVAMPK